MRRLILVGSIMTPLLFLPGVTPASAFGWYGYRDCDYGYAPRYYRYSYRPYYGYAYSGPRYFYRGYYRPRFYGYRGWGWRGHAWGRGWRRW